MFVCRERRRLTGVEIEKIGIVLRKQLQMCLDDKAEFESEWAGETENCKQRRVQDRWQQVCGSTGVQLFGTGGLVSLLCWRFDRLRNTLGVALSYSKTR